MANFTGSIADAGRVIHIAKRRERHKEDIELKKKKLAAETAAVNIGEKFSAHYDAVEQQLKSSTVGLVTLEEMKARRETMVQEREKRLAHKKWEAELKLQRELEEEQRRLREERERLKQKSCLSFDIDEEEQQDEDAGEAPIASEERSRSPGSSKWDKRRIGKDPTVDTSFLPDREREEEEDRLREQLRLEWVAQQEKVKNEEINIAFSYWDGSGHRRDAKMRKGDSIHRFLQTALEMLRPDFNELRSASADNLMFVKEDLIIAHFYTFHDFIVTKAVGKTGPLFEFDAAGELRIRQDANVDHGESHPAKVILRSWYERNKHIYPASHWEPFDPNKRYKNEDKGV